MIINNIGINFAGGGGGGKSAVLETKDYTITSNGTTSIQPSEGVDGISGGTITVDVPELTENRLRLFANDQITAVTQSDLSGVTRLRDYLFTNQKNLVTVDLPSSVNTIGNSMFAGCTALTSVNTENVTAMTGLNTFQDCYSLTGITFNQDFQKGVQMPQNMFQNCRSLQGDISIPYDRLNSAAFQNCSGLTSVTFANDNYEVATGTYQRPFQGCTGIQYLDFTHNYRIPKLADTNCFTAFTQNYEIKVPNKLVDAWKATSGWSATSIVDHIVGYPDLFSSVTISFTSTGDVNPNVAYNNTNWGTVGVESSSSTSGVTFYGPEPKIPNNAYSGKTALQTVSIGNGFTSMGYGVFNGCTGIQSAVLDDDITNIPGTTFQNCSSLSSVTMSSAVTYIGSNAFYGCTSLKNFDIPSSVTVIGNNAFMGSGLESVSVENANIAEGAFRNCQSLTSAQLGTGVTSIATMGFMDCTALTSVTLTDSVTGISNDSFKNCALTEFDIPSGVTQIWYGTFQNCPLKRVIIPDTVTEIRINNGGPWGGCTQIQEVRIPGYASGNQFGVNGYFADSKASITACTLAEGIASIDNYAFSGCTGITSLVIPSTVRIFVGAGGFKDCTSLTSITFKSSTPPTTSGVASDRYMNMPTNGTLYCPADAVSAYTTWLTQSPQANSPISTWTVQAIS